MSRSQQHTRTLFLVEFAALTAILLLMEVTGLGMLHIFALEMTILQVPVIIGAIVLGSSAGAGLGLVFGLISFWECFGRSPFGAQLLAINPFLTFLVCVPTRVLMGWLCGLIFKNLDCRLRQTKANLVSYAVASLSGAILNTVFFMAMLCLCFYRTDYIQGFVSSAGASNVLIFIAMFVGVQGLIEALICGVLGTAVSKGVRYALHR